MVTNEQLIQEYRNGSSEALTILIKQNEGLIRKVAYQYSLNGRYDMDDLIQEAYLGFIRAVDKYNFDLENRAAFSTYSVYWINMKLNMYTKRNKSITLSLDAPMGNDDEDISLMDTIADSSPGPEELEEESDYRRDLRCRVSRAMADELTLKQQEIIKMRYGFYGSCAALEKIGDMFECSGESIRQQEKRSLRKLRHCTTIVQIQQEMCIDSYIKNISRCTSTEAAALKRASRSEALSKNTMCPCISKEPFYKWYAGLYKARAS
jgi:RNA polymerase sigma factor (sigma-70 family)